MRFIGGLFFFFIISSCVSQTSNEHKHGDWDSDHFHDKELGLSIAFIIIFNITRKWFQRRTVSLTSLPL